MDKTFSQLKNVPSFLQSINTNQNVPNSLIVDLNLKGKLVIVVGGGQEGLKKIKLASNTRLQNTSD
jgi:Siroheme synthase (precorrin-2 oxidase/ferrochelatase domain)